MDNSDIYLVASLVKFFKLTQDSPEDTLFHINLLNQRVSIQKNLSAFQPGDVYILYTNRDRNLNDFLNKVTPDFPLYFLSDKHALVQVSVAPGSSNLSPASRVTVRELPSLPGAVVKVLQL